MIGYYSLLHVIDIDFGAHLTFYTNGTDVVREHAFLPGSRGKQSDERRYVWWLGPFEVNEDIPRAVIVWLTGGQLNHIPHNLCICGGIFILRSNQSLN
jgi:hypothetical protein